jgi:hypothetical protein
MLEYPHDHKETSNGNGTRQDGGLEASTVFDSMNEKSQITQERYSDERKRGRTLAITEEVAGHQKSHEKQATVKSITQF